MKVKGPRVRWWETGRVVTEVSSDIRWAAAFFFSGCDSRILHWLAFLAGSIKDLNAFLRKDNISLCKTICFIITCLFFFPFLKPSNQVLKKKSHEAVEDSSLHGWGTVFLLPLKHTMHRWHWQEDWWIFQSVRVYFAREVSCVKSRLAGYSVCWKGSSSLDSSSGFSSKESFLVTAEGKNQQS